MSVFEEMLARHVGSAFSRQIAFAERLGERGWQVDVEAGQVRFGDDLVYPIQLLGTESEGDRSWLWAWANQASNLPAELLVTCEKLRDLGLRENIPELSQRSFPLSTADGHSLALLASGLEEAGSCYYRGGYPGGALYFLVEKALPAVAAPLPQERVVSVIGQLVGQFDLKHRVMIEGFLVDQGFHLRVQDDTLLASRQGTGLTLEFDPMGRMINLKGTLVPPEAQTKAPARKPRWKFW